MGCTYVKDFDFGPSKVAVKAYCRGGPVKKAKGGVVEKTTGEKYPSRKAMVKHEKEETPQMQREELLQRVAVKAPARRAVPVAPASPLLAMKKGGKASCGCA